MQTVNLQLTQDDKIMSSARLNLTNNFLANYQQREENAQEDNQNINMTPNINENNNGQNDDIEELKKSASIFKNCIFTLLICFSLSFLIFLYLQLQFSKEYLFFINTIFQLSFILINIISENGEKKLFLIESLNIFFMSVSKLIT